MVSKEVRQESRVKKTLLNARVNLIFYFLTLILSFFSRKIFLDCLGADFIGLTGTLQTLLGFLNLAELGIGAAIGYLLYKPLFEHDEEKINEIISVMGYLYRWIGFIILGAGLILAGFLPLIFPDSDTHLTLPLIYFAYLAFLGSTLIGYFINYRQNLLGADQRNYVVTAYFQTGNIVKMLIQMAFAYYTKNLYIWVAIEFIFGIIYSFILNWKINQVYPWLKANVKLGHNIFKKYPEVMKKTKQVFVHKMGGFVQYQVTPFLIYSFASLTSVAFYQNYTIVISRISALFSNFYAGLGASIGNLIAEGNESKTLNVFWELLSLNFFMAGLICIPVYLLINPFIIVWLGESYLLPQTTLILILIPVFINSVRGIVDSFNNGYGMFWDVWSPIVECIILLGASIACGYFWGLNGVLLGPIAALVFVIMLWKPFMLFHWGFKRSVLTYWLVYIKNLGCVAGAFYITFLLKQYIHIENSKNFLDWVLYSIPIFLIYAISSYILFLFFSTGMKAFNQRITRFVTKLIHR